VGNYDEIPWEGDQGQLSSTVVGTRTNYQSISHFYFARKEGKTRGHERVSTIGFTNKWNYFAFVLIAACLLARNVYVYIHNQPSRGALSLAGNLAILGCINQLITRFRPSQFRAYTTIEWKCNVAATNESNESKTNPSIKLPNNDLGEGQGSGSYTWYSAINRRHYVYTYSHQAAVLLGDYVTRPAHRVNRSHL